MIQTQMCGTRGRKKTSNQRHNTAKDNRIILLNHIKKEKTFTQIKNKG